MLDTDRFAQVADTIRTDFEACDVDSRSDDELEEEIAELCIHIDAATLAAINAPCSVKPYGSAFENLSLERRSQFATPSVYV